MHPLANHRERTKSKPFIFDLNPVKSPRVCLGKHQLGAGAVELVADRGSKKPADKAVPAKVQDGAYKAGAMVRVSGPNIILSPPLVLTAADVDVILSALDAGFSAA